MPNDDRSFLILRFFESGLRSYERFGSPLIDEFVDLLLDLSK